MRCSCRACGQEIWMVQAESDALGCVCPVCGFRCRDCLGTDTVVPREGLAALARDPRFLPENLQRLFDPSGEPRDDDPEDAGGDGEIWIKDGGF